MAAVSFDHLARRCNEFLYVHQYPRGTLVFRSRQHRDLVRSFFAGALETLMAAGERESVEALMPEYETMADAHWAPDRRFAPPNGYVC